MESQRQLCESCATVRRGERSCFERERSFREVASRGRFERGRFEREERVWRVEK